MIIFPFASAMLSIHYLSCVRFRRRHFLYGPTNQLQHYLEIRQYRLKKTVHRYPDQKIGVWESLTISFDVSLIMSYTEMFAFHEAYQYSNRIHFRTVTHLCASLSLPFHSEGDCKMKHNHGTLSRLLKPSYERSFLITPHLHQCAYSLEPNQDF